MESLAQSAPGGLAAEQRLIPPAPTTAGLGTYGRLPVDLNAGAVSVGVPLGEVRCRSLAVPVSLSYRTTGVRVEEVASWVGLGWSLNAGGLITRTVRGQPDETSNTGYFTAFPRWQAAERENRLHPSIASRAAKYEVDQDAANGLIDTEPDTYSLSLPGQSATFLLDVNQHVHLNPFKQWAVTGSPSSTWGVVLPDGVTYQFETPELTEADNGIPFITAWHLTTIISANGKDRIAFEYVDNGQAQVVPTKRVFRTKLYLIPYSSGNNNASYCAMDPPFSNGYAEAPVKYNTQSLRRITTTTTTVELISDAVRPDLDPISDAPGRRLTAVVFTDVRHPEITRRFELTHSPNSGRLRLSAVQQVGQPGYAFAYDDSATLPARTSYAQDHWGYYNGASNSTLIPLPPATVAIGRLVNADATANRATNPLVMQVGVLKSVRYPTGGYSYFTYEANSVWESSARDETITTFTAAASGLSGNNPPALNPASQAVYDVLFPSGSVTGNPSVTAEMFTLPLGATNLRFEPTPTDGVNGAHYGLYKLNDPSGDPGTFQNSGTQIFPVPPNNTGFVYPPATLAAGTYLLYTSTPDVSTPARVTVRLHVVTPDPSRERAVGGLRIRRMVDYTQMGDSLVTTYDYTRYNSTAQRRISTGQLFFDPKYIRFSPCGAAILAAADATTMTYAQEGYHIGYEQVGVTQRGSTNGTTIYRYLNSSDANARNQVIAKIILDGSSRVVKQLDNTYYEGGAEVVPLQKVTLNAYNYSTCLQLGCPEYYVIGAPIYETFESAFQCAQEPLLGYSREQRFAFSPAGSIAAGTYETSRTYSYARLPTGQLFSLPTWVRQSSTNGSQLATRTTYAHEYATASLAATAPDGPTQGLAELAAHHQLGEVVETQQWRHQGGDSLLIGGTLTHYAGLQVRRSWELETAVPLLATAVTSAHVQGNRFVFDPRYAEQTSYDHYGPWENLLEQHHESRRRTYLWNDDGSHVLAQVDQARYAQAGYTSFEPSAAGRWTYDLTSLRQRACVTGRWAYAAGSAPVALDSVPAGTYILTLWATAPLIVSLNGSAIPTPVPIATDKRATGTSFACYRYHFPLNEARSIVALTGPTGALLDEVRLYPEGAQMQSNTNVPLDGELSQTDASGRIVTYEYDSLGRLVRTRDEQGRVLSQQQYHYAGH